MIQVDTDRSVLCSKNQSHNHNRLSSFVHTHTLICKSLRNPENRRKKTKQWGVSWEQQHVSSSLYNYYWNSINSKLTTSVSSPFRNPSLHVGSAFEAAWHIWSMQLRLPAQSEFPPQICQRVHFAEQEPPQSTSLSSRSQLPLKQVCHGQHMHEFSNTSILSRQSCSVAKLLSTYHSLSSKVSTT